MSDSEKPFQPGDAIEKTFAMQDTRAQRAHWLGNIRANTAEIEKGHDIRALHDLFWDLPGIVIGAGPSLAKNAHLLVAEQKKYPLFCCDRAYRKVHDIGLEPQFAIVADASNAVPGFFDGVDTRGIILVVPTYVSPLLLKLPWKKKIFYNILDDSDKGYESAALNMTGHRITAIPAGVIVGNMAMIIAKIAGCNPITFIGSDLSMPEPSSRPGERTFETVDKNGNKIYSLPGFLAGLEWLLRFTQVDKDINSGILKIYNSTEGGIMYSDIIKGLPLKKFISEYSGSNKSLNTILNQNL